jgi:predicted O-linked N-acetylglucosamine transferase (SPINDLY family)
MKKILSQPNVIDQLFHQGVSLHQQGKLENAKSIYQQVLNLQPKHFDALHLLGVIAAQTGNPEFAANLIGKAIELNPNAASAHSNRGNALKELKRLDEALICYDKAIALQPDFPEALNNKGIVLKELNCIDEALVCYGKAIAIRPRYAEAHYNQGNIFKKIKRLNEALASYDMAISIKPNYVEAVNDRGSVLKELQQLGEALKSYDMAIAMQPDYVDAHYNRGNLLIELKRLEEALESYNKALALQPDYDFLLGLQLNTRASLCDWRELPEQLASLELALEAERKVIIPFSALGLTDNPKLQYLASKIYGSAKFPASAMLGEIKKRTPDGIIRIGYYSADFHNHATTYLMAELFDIHDPRKFEVCGFSFGHRPKDEMGERVSLAFNKFFDVSSLSDREVTLLSRQLGIDIAVDLKGYTKDNRVGIFAARCAPIQVSYLGYPGTLGVGYIDYVIADKTVLPESSQDHFTEKAVYLPHSYQVNDSKRKISDRVFTKTELGLPQKGFIFCCFNNNYKILPETFDGWMRILKAVEGSVLWLLEDNITAATNLREAARARGVDINRLVFVERIKLDEHLARHRLADLFIDTFPCNAHTTASDALWVGLPVLTCMGRSFASRVAGSLLNALELPELITYTQEEYETRAIALATNPYMLEEVRTKLERNRLNTPLFNTRLFAKHIEAAYKAMYAREQAGLPPEHIEIQSII